MAFKTKIRPFASRQIASWGLSDFVWTEVLLRLNEVLPSEPSFHLRRERRPFDGLVYRFSMADPENRLCEHYFCFHIVYGQDEETL